MIEIWWTRSNPLLNLVESLEKRFKSIHNGFCLQHFATTQASRINLSFYALVFSFCGFLPGCGWFNKFNHICLTCEWYYAIGNWLCQNKQKTWDMLNSVALLFLEQCGHQQILGSERGWCQTLSHQPQISRRSRYLCKERGGKVEQRKVWILAPELKQLYVPWSKVAILGMGDLPPLMTESLYWVYKPLRNWVDFPIPYYMEI